MDLKKLSAQDQERLLKDIAKNKGDVAAAQSRQWVREAVRYTKKLAAEGTQATPETRTAFWIRVAGVFGEVHSNLAGQLRTLETFLAMPEQQPGQHERLRVVYQEPIAELVQVVAAAKNALTEDELLYLLYRRDTECHPWQDGYRIRLGKNGLLDKRGVFGREWTVEEMDAALVQILRKFAVNEAAIAATFAQRLLALMEAVYAASERWYGAAAPD